MESLEEEEDEEDEANGVERSKVHERHAAGAVTVIAIGDFEGV